MNGRTTKGHRSWRVEGCSQPSFNAAPHGSVIVLGGLLGSLLFLASPVHAEFSSKEDGTRFFEEKIRPVLAEKCYSCHSAESEKLKGSLQVDHLEHLLAGGDTGPSLVPGKPDDSLLVEAIAYGNPDLRMPPKEKLSAAVVEDFRKWITGGAPWPEESVPQTGKKVAGAGFDLEKRHAEHWSWRPIVKPAVPAVKDTIWASTPVDAFLLAKIEPPGFVPPRLPTTAPGCDAFISILPACPRHLSRSPSS
jgi:hypothetical protein